jgi:hypothetical protein
MNLPRKVFIDTSFLIALLRSNDSDHTRVLALHQQLEVENVRKLTSEYVLLELGNSLSRLRVRQLAMNFFRRLYQDRTIEVIPTSSEIFTQALTLFNTRSDKEWGLTDCTSFVIMRKFKIDMALTMDHHFQQAGFRALLLED